MKKITLLILILTSTFLTAQRRMEIVQWEAKTASGIKVFGIAPDVYHAELAISDFEKNHKQKKHILKDKTIRPALIMANGENDNPFIRFQVLAQKKYKMLDLIEQNTLNIIKKRGLNAGVAYHQKVMKTSRAFSYTKFFELTTAYRQFIIKDNSMTIATITKTNL